MYMDLADPWWVGVFCDNYCWFTKLHINVMIKEMRAYNIHVLKRESISPPGAVVAGSADGHVSNIILY